MVEVVAIQWLLEAKPRGQAVRKLYWLMIMLKNRWMEYESICSLDWSGLIQGLRRKSGSIACQHPVLQCTVDSVQYQVISFFKSYCRSRCQTIPVPPFMARIIHQIVAKNSFGIFQCLCHDFPVTTELLLYRVLSRLNVSSRTSSRNSIRSLYQYCNVIYLGISPADLSLAT